MFDFKNFKVEDKVFKFRETIKKESVDNNNNSTVKN